MKDKQRIYSGIKPSGKITLGNYIGAIGNWIELADDYDCLYCVADLHAITERQDPKELRRLTIESMAQYIASGLDPEKNILYIQSHVPAHTELSWVLGCMTYMGELSRMTQYKDKSQKNADNLNAGLFTYPVLMAADILLYQTDLVPVGEDQKQHLEIARDIANRFNNRYSETFVIPDIFVPKVGARIMSLQDPEKKMSKSDENVNATIYITDSPEDIERKFKRAVTDSLGKVAYNEEQKGVRNLLEIHGAVTGKKAEEVALAYQNKGYGELKKDTAEAVIEKLRPIREKYLQLLQDKTYLESVYKTGAEQASKIAAKTLAKVYKKTGFIPRS